MFPKRKRTDSLPRLMVDSTSIAAALVIVLCLSLFRDAVVVTLASLRCRYPIFSVLTWMESPMTNDRQGLGLLPLRSQLLREPFLKKEPLSLTDLCCYCCGS